MASLYDTGGWASVGPAWVWVNPGGKHVRTYEAGKYTTRRRISRADFKELTKDATETASLQDPAAFLAAYKAHLATLDHTDHIAKAALHAAAKNPDAVAYWKHDIKARHDKKVGFFVGALGLLGGALGIAAEVDRNTAALSDLC